MKQIYLNISFKPSNISSFKGQEFYKTNNNKFLIIIVLVIMRLFKIILIATLILQKLMNLLEQ